MHFEHLEHAIDQAAKSLPAPAVKALPETTWQPLEALIGPALWGQFMYMGESAAPDGTPIMLYKHGMTRSYLNVSADLRTWRYVACAELAGEGSYAVQPLAAALANVFHQCEELGAKPNMAYDAEFRAKRDAALADAGYRTVTARPGLGVC
jgi:hypothetical protein